MPKKTDETPKPNPIVRELVETLEREAGFCLREIAEGEDEFDARGHLTDGGTLLSAAWWLRTLEHRVTEVEAIGRSQEKRARAAEDDLRKAMATIDKLTTKAAAPAPAPEKKAAGAKACKDHDWDTTKTPPVCKLCGKTKSNRGRKSVSNPAANVTVATVEGVTKVDPPSLPLPTGAPAKKGGTVTTTDGREIDLSEADEFEAGTVGGL